MKKKTIALYVLVFALAIVVAWTIVEAQSKDPKPDPVAPAVSDKMHAKIRDVQLELSTLLNQQQQLAAQYQHCLLYTSPSPRDRQKSRMPSSA